MNVTPVTLEGRIARLEPLEERHVADLAVAGADPSIWRFMPYGLATTPERMAEFVRQTRALREGGSTLPFAVIDRTSGRAVGCTRYLDIQPGNRGLEIGGTWYAVDRWRTGLNTECKRLLLSHAFDALGAIRVQLKTDLRNERSQRAIERLGAIREGVLRDNTILPDGYVRSTVYYSILAREWPAIGERLDGLASR